MKKRLPLLLLVLLAALAFWLWRSRTDGTLAGPLTDFAIQDTARIDRIFIAQKDGLTADLRRVQRADGGYAWTVNGLPANPIPVKLLLKTFRRVEVRNPVPMSMQAHVLKTMSTLAVKVEVYAGDDEPEKIWYVGHATQDHFGVFAVLELPGEGRSDRPFVLGMTGFTGIINTRFHARLDEWRSTDVVIRPDLARVARVQVEHPSVDSAGYTLVNDGGKLSLLDESGAPLPLDTTVGRDLLLHLTDAHFEFFERRITKAQKDSILATRPWHVLTVTDTDGSALRVPFWKKDPYPGEKTVEFEELVDDLDRMYALVQDTALVVVQRYWFDRMVPYRGQVVR